MGYRFTISMRQYRTGDPVPETFDEGVIGTMIERGFIEPIKAEEKRLDAVPENKSMSARPVASKRQSRGTTSFGPDGTIKGSKPVPRIVM